MIAENICSYITRKSLLYKSKVEYGIWAINHIEGCKHGCKFPCYAFMMSKRFGRVKNYEEWLKPRITENSIELLEKELVHYKGKIEFIHLSFMTDPFMYDIENDNLIQEIKDLSLEIIKLINRHNIKVTTLTKGFYPEDLIDKGFSLNNEYGITLVSLNTDFKEKFEPFTSPYDTRIDSLRELHKAGYKTWVSIEPYPTPNIDPSAYDIEDLLNKIKFVDKIVFGKMNYNINTTLFKDSLLFYKKIAKKVISFCNKKEIIYHIKKGTPLENNNNRLFL